MSSDGANNLSRGFINISFDASVIEISQTNSNFYVVLNSSSKGLQTCESHCHDLPSLHSVVARDDDGRVSDRRSRRVNLAFYSSAWVKNKSSYRDTGYLLSSLFTSSKICFKCISESDLNSRCYFIRFSIIKCRKNILCSYFKGHLENSYCICIFRNNNFDLIEF